MNETKLLEAFNKVVEAIGELDNKQQKRCVDAALIVCSRNEPIAICNKCGRIKPEAEMMSRQPFCKNCY